MQDNFSPITGTIANTRREELAMCYTTFSSYKMRYTPNLPVPAYGWLYEYPLGARYDFFSPLFWPLLIIIYQIFFLIPRKKYTKADDLIRDALKTLVEINESYCNTGCIYISASDIFVHTQAQLPLYIYTAESYSYVSE